MIPEAFKPRQDNERVIVLTSRRDDFGKCQFDAYWNDARKPEGVAAQVFRANPDGYVERWEREGMTVRLIDHAKGAN